jgi:hypothetical protein
LPADATTRPPAARTGAITSIPSRVPQLSAIQPMNGSSSRPGTAHHEPTANPTARARDGMAMDMIDSTPGSTTASSIVRAMLTTTATGTDGARAKRAAHSADSREVHFRNRNTSDGSRRNSRVPSLAPTARPTSWNGSTTAAR